MPAFPASENPFFFHCDITPFYMQRPAVDERICDLFRAQRRILWNVGCEIPIACAASSCSIPRRSFSLIASYSSRDSVVFPQHVLFPPVGFRLMAAGFWHILLHLLGRAFFSGYEYIFIWIYKWKLYYSALNQKR